MAIVPMSGKFHMNTMIEFLQLPPPEVVRESIHGDFRAFVTLTLPDKPDRTFYGPPNPSADISEEMAARDAAQFLWDHYSHNQNFQTFILNDVYCADPFEMEYFVAEVQVRNTLLVNENNHLTAHNATLQRKLDDLSERFRRVKDSFVKIGQELSDLLFN